MHLVQTLAIFLGYIRENPHASGPFPPATDQPPG